MKKCVPRTSDRIITVLAAIFCAAIAVFAFWELIYGDQAPVVFTVMGIFFGCTSIHILWRTIQMGNWGFYYDDEKILFVLSHKDFREFRWDELQGSQTNLFYSSSPASWYFYFPDKKKIAVTPRMTGYNEFIDMLRKKGFPARSPGELNFDQAMVKDIFQNMFGDQFGKNDKKL